MNTKKTPRIVVLGVGNAFLSDEGVAGRVLREVARRVPPWVEVVDAGLPGPGLLGLLEGREKAVIVDAVDGGRPPGTVYSFHPNEAVPVGRRRCCSLHEGNVLLYLKLSETLGVGAEEVIVVGVQPEDLSPGENLSSPVERAVPEAAALVLSEVLGEGRPLSGELRLSRREVTHGSEC